VALFLRKLGCTIFLTVAATLVVPFLLAIWPIFDDVILFRLSVCHLRLVPCSVVPMLISSSLEHCSTLSGLKLKCLRELLLHWAPCCHAGNNLGELVKSCHLFFFVCLALSEDFRLQSLFTCLVLAAETDLKYSFACDCVTLSSILVPILDLH